MTERNFEEKARRKAEVVQSGARWRGLGGRTGNNGISCRLLHRLGTAQRANIWPSNAFGPVVGKPLESTLERAGGEIAAVDNVVELGAPVENDRRQALATETRGFGVGIGNSDKLLS